MNSARRSSRRKVQLAREKLEPRTLFTGTLLVGVPFLVVVWLVALRLL